MEQELKKSHSHTEKKNWSGVCSRILSFKIIWAWSRHLSDKTDAQWTCSVSVMFKSSTAEFSCPGPWKSQTNVWCFKLEYWFYITKSNPMYFQNVCRYAKCYKTLTEVPTHVCVHAYVCVNCPLTFEVTFVLLQDWLGLDTRRHDWPAPFTAHEFAKS